MSRQYRRIAVLVVVFLVCQASYCLADVSIPREPLPLPEPPAESRIIAYCIDPSSDYNCDGVVDRGDCFVDVLWSGQATWGYHSIMPVTLGWWRRYEAANSWYEYVYEDVLRVGVNRLWIDVTAAVNGSDSLLILERRVEWLDMSGAGWYDVYIIDQIDYEALTERDIVEYH